MSRSDRLGVIGFERCVKHLLRGCAVRLEPGARDLQIIEALPECGRVVVRRSSHGQAASLTARGSEGKAGRAPTGISVRGTAEGAVWRPPAKRGGLSVGLHP